MRNMSQREVTQLAEEAYIYGYPLVLMEVTRRVMTCASAPDPLAQKAPIGQFVHLRATPTAASKDVEYPNVDTLYSLAWLDLSVEPMVLHVPDTHGTYYLMPLLDAWTEVVGSLGKRTTGTRAGDFGIVGPGWSGPLPAALKQVTAPTNLVWIIGRTQIKCPADLSAVHAIQQGFHLKPLSAWRRLYTPPQVPLDSSVDVVTSPVDQVAHMDAATFFRTFAAALRTNPPHAADAQMVAQLERLGIISGQSFDIAVLEATARRALQQAIPVAQEQIQAEASRIASPVNGWMCGFGLGKYGTDYLRRAAVALSGLGADLTADAFYPYAESDTMGEPLTGAGRYVLHFAPHRTPPVVGFWSLTMYGLDHLFVDNPINRYALGSRDALHFNPDGSLDISIQHDEPGPDKRANWLPAPRGDFNLILRMYWPKPEVLNRAWIPPTIEQVPWVLPSPHHVQSTVEAEPST